MEESVGGVESLARWETKRTTGREVETGRVSTAQQKIQKNEKQFHVCCLAGIDDEGEHLKLMWLPLFSMQE
jgi:hypothetical protein